MNSRQRRKLEAHNHNMASIESEAYAEDKARNPEKYRTPRNKNAERSLGLVIAVCAAISPTTFDDRQWRQ